MKPQCPHTDTGLCKTCFEYEVKIGELNDTIEQLRVQLAGCGVAALGYAKDKNDCNKGDYGWSASFQDVKDLWGKYTSLREQLNKKVLSREEITQILVNTNLHDERNMPITFTKASPDKIIDITLSYETVYKLATALLNHGRISK